MSELIRTSGGGGGGGGGAKECPFAMGKYIGIVVIIFHPLEEIVAALWLSM